MTNRISFTRLRRTALSLALASSVLSLSACADYRPAEKRIAMEQHNYSYTLPAHSSLDHLTKVEYDNVTTMLQQVPAKAVDAIVLESSVEDMRTSGKLDELTLLISQSSLSDIGLSYAQLPASETPASTLYLTYHALTLPHPCPDWRHSSIFNHDNSKMSNYGCATQTNVGRQVKRKQDLIKGRGNRINETDTNIRAIERFNAGEIGQTIDVTESATTDD